MESPIKTSLRGDMLDHYLSLGWYRTGMSMFTTRYSHYESGYLTTVWTRLPLLDYEPPKRMRQLMRRNRQYLRYEVHPARATVEEERVFKAYAASKPYELGSSVIERLRGNSESPFDTWQISVYIHEELIAFSHFDRGNFSMQSIFGYYSPEYQHFSLGLYTLLLEIQVAKECGMSYHYSGYIVPGNSVFEYKRRVGSLEAFDDITSNWYPIEQLKRAALPDAILRNAQMAYEDLFMLMERSLSLDIRRRMIIDVSQGSLQGLVQEEFPFAFETPYVKNNAFNLYYSYSFNHRRFFILVVASSAWLEAHESDEKALAAAGLKACADFHSKGRDLAVKGLQLSETPFLPAHILKAEQQLELLNRTLDNRLKHLQ